MTKEKCSNCLSYNQDQGTCENSRINDIEYNVCVCSNTVDFSDYCYKQDDKVLVGKLYWCELYQAV